ncbi:hypothetical protein ILUMI_03862 [Ignelater luminosus]|uniref:U4/U6.U5 tri-snRNP-associated protein 1 n=1 Tax=Ignelater luminosus TaxID=2038154 RepID=A0A8K0GJJ1_IGNLU|nr:hypothetical protein ILUMI_03862 [Ignelater luminosus]
MGSSSKRSKEKESRKRRHRSRSESYEREAPKEKKHRHHRRHHKDRKREKHQKHEYESEDSDVVEVVSPDVVRVVTPPPPSIPSDNKHSSPEPCSTGQSVESLSIEETNKLRAKLGLKPLHIDRPGDKSSKRDDGKKKDDLGEFYHKPALNMADKAEQEKIRLRLAEHREKRNVDSKLSKVTLLGEKISDDEDDAVAWVKRNRRLDDAKKEAERRAKMLEELDAQFGIGEIIESEQRAKRNQQYSDRNLRGLQVDHDIDSFQEGQTVVLTLKDQEVLNDDDDVLVNVNLQDGERYKKNIENKKKKGYTAYEDEELDEFGNLKPKSLLGKYDEEIEGEKREGFRIGHVNAAERKQAMLQSIKNKLSNKLVESLVTPELSIASDYYNEEEMAKFKKPKKKKGKLRTKIKALTADDLEQSRIMDKHGKMKREMDHLDYDDVPVTAVHTKVEVKLEDEYDDTLERALHKARKLKQRESTIVNTLTSIDIKPEPAEENVDAGSIVLNATAEFCRTLGDIPTYGKSGNREDSENLLELENDFAEDMDVEDEEEVDEGGKWNAVDPTRVVKEPVPEAVIETPILDEEPDVGSGVGAALKLAMSKGYLDKEDGNRPSNSRLAHLQAQHYSIEDKSYGDEFERGNRRERYSGPIMDFKEKDTFKPNVKLEYIDDEGHVLNAKEAFRYLSHKFHGKGPGKNKIEKRLKKTQQEGLMKKMSSTDTPLGTLNMLQSKQKEMQSPYIVLSGGKHTHSTTIAKARR